MQSLPSADIIKRNGRRIVVDLGRPVYLQEDVQFIQSLVDHSNVLVELDYPGLTTPSQVQFVYSDVLDVTAADNSSDLPAGGFWNLADSEPYGIHVQSVWRLTNSTPVVVVALLDSGLAAPAFSAFLRLGGGYDFISDPTVAMDCDGRDADFTDPGDSGPACPVPSWHGTKVASVLAADHAVFPGVAPNCTLLPVRVLGMCRTGYASDVADAIVWASGGAVEGVPINPTPGRVVSMSFTGDADCPSYLQAAIDEAVQLGALPVAASGNDGVNTTDFFPANCQPSPPPVYGAFVCLLSFYLTQPYTAGTTDNIGQAIYGAGVSCCDISGNLIGTSLITGSWSTSTSNDQMMLYGANTFTVPYTVYWTWTFAGVSMLSCSNPPCYFGDDLGASSAGEVYPSTCSAGQVVTGVFGWHGSYLDEMSPECNNLCTGCAPGTYGTTGASCTSCPAGAYSASSGLTTCTTCTATMLEQARHYAVLAALARTRPQEHHCAVLAVPEHILLQQPEGLPHQDPAVLAAQENFLP